MKSIIIAILIIISVSANSQGKQVDNEAKIYTAKNDKGTTNNLVDTAAIRKENEAANKFVQDLITKTSIADFQKWMYETIPAKQMNEASFQALYNYFIQQKYIASKQPKK